MNDHDALRESIPLYAFGVLDGQERARVEAHLADGCDACEAALRDARAVADALGDATMPVSPSPATRRALLGRAHRDAAAHAPSAAARPGRARWLAVPLAASLAGLAVLGLYAWDRADGLEAERARRVALETTLAEVRAELEVARAHGARDEETVARLEALVRDLTAPDTRMVALAGQPAAPGASARAFLDPDAGQVLLFVYGLPATPPGRTYQLWVIVGGSPVSAGIFQIDQQGRARHRGLATPDISGPVTVAVSVEPEGGVAQPTGPIVLAGGPGG